MVAGALWGLVGAALVPTSGCGASCRGPGCESSFARGRLSLVTDLAAGDVLDVWEDADLGWTGAAEEGADWHLDAVTDGAGGVLLLVGQPGAGRVVAASPTGDPDATAEVALPLLSTWLGEPLDEFGAAVVAVPTGAGFDLWVGAPAATFGQGTVSVFRGQAAEPELVLVGGTPNDRFGDELTRCGDLTGDLVPDVIVSAPGFAQPNDDVPWTDAVENLAGAVILVDSARAAGASGEHRPWELGTVWFGEEIGDGFGTGVLCDRDVDGDGVLDVLIGAPWARGGQGKVYAFSADALPAAGRIAGAAVTRGTTTSWWLGTSFAAFGSELVAVGQPGSNRDEVAGTGRVVAFAGAALRAGNAVSIGVFERDDAAEGAHQGRRLYGGDVDGDGVRDLLVGTPDARGPGGEFDTGSLDVWLGTAAAVGVHPEPDATIAGATPFQRIGRAAEVVDVDGDGADDLLLPTRAPGRRED